MQTTLRHLVCLLALGTFLCMALASDFLDESTNVSVNLKPSDCQVKPPINRTMRVIVTNNNSDIDAALYIEIFVNNQKILDTLNCTSFYQYEETKTLVVLPSMSDFYESPSFLRDNKGDLWRVEIRARPINVSSITWAFKETRVLFYDETVTTFTFGEKPKL